MIRAVISDFGGVLTTPLLHSFAAYQDQTGISAAALGNAMQTVAEREGEHPLFELEKGKVTEEEFLRSIAEALGGHCRTLRRTEIGPFRVEDADEERIIPADEALALLA